jgi:beta-glucuronidase
MKRKNRIVSAFCLFLFGSAVLSAESIIQNAYNRDAYSLNGKWHYIVDMYESGFYNFRYKAFDDYDDPTKSGGFFVNHKPKNKTDRVEYGFDGADMMIVPGDWNSQKENLYYYEGSVWLRRVFDYQKKHPNNRVFIYFGAANYRTDTYLNAHKLGVHIGGFTPFNYEITDILKDTGNYLITRVDNTRHMDAVPTVNTDWWNFGGITRDVKIIEVPSTFVSDYMIQLKKGSMDKIKGYVQLNGDQKAKKEVNINIPELNISQTVTTDKQGYADVEFTADNIQHWSDNNPKLYNVTIAALDDVIEDQIGFRSIETKGHNILLNGKSIFLKGICIHEENPIRGGRAYCMEDARMLLGWAKELGCNFVRLAHYPHNEHIIRLADKMGMLVWEENPVYWTIQWESMDTYETAKNQLDEVISRDKNRASVIIWSMANETPESEPRMKFLKGLRDFTLEKDNTRLISAALLTSDYNDDQMLKTIDDPFAEYVDVLAFNQYIGWYWKLPDYLDNIKWIMQQDKPVVVSEFGAGALQGFHGDSLTRWTEEFQAYLYRETLEMLAGIPELRGITPWILADFHSPKRLLPEIQDGWNRKGLIGETGDKKKAFFILKDFYDEISVEKMQE